MKGKFCYFLIVPKQAMIVTAKKMQFNIAVCSFKNGLIFSSQTLFENLIHGIKSQQSPNKNPPKKFFKESAKPQEYVSFAAFWILKSLLLPAHP